jgi:uncharacterized protein YhbP (UPF0306 family)
MADALRERIMNYMDRCPVCTIATVGVDGQPNVAAVYFKRKGLDVYFNSDRSSRKVQNILANPRVAIAMQEDAPVPRASLEIKGIQSVGTAGVLADGNTAGVPRAVISRHNAFNRTGSGSSVIVRVTLAEISLIDYSLGLQHRDQLLPQSGTDVYQSVDAATILRYPRLITPIVTVSGLDAGLG